MTRRHTLAVLGAGMHGRVLMRSLQQEGRAELRWVCSATAASTDAAAAEFNVPQRSTDWRDALADPAVDAVVIATPPHLHAPQLLAALQAGKHVLVEKPLATSPEALAQVLAAVAQAPGRVVLDASCRHTRLQPKFGFIKALIDSDRLGRIYHVHHNHLARGTFVEYNPKGAWALDRRLAGGGPFIDWGVYDLSFHLGLLGDVPRLAGLRRFHVNGLRDMSRLAPVADVEQHGAAWLEFDTGLTYHYERGAGVHAETPNETRLYGTQGGLRFQYPSWDSPVIEFFHDDGELRHERLQAPAATLDDHQALATHFLDCLDGSAEPTMPVERAARHLDILFRILA